MTGPDTPQDVLDFWRAAESDWFSHAPEFDARFRERFLGLHMAVAARDRDDWAATAPGALALVLLTDQFPRNAFRGTGHMYATDGLARAFAVRAQDAGLFERTEPALRLFLAMPFAHSEDLADQDRSVALNARLGQPWLSHAEGHRAIIRRFGRFPHRNPLLGRETTPEEAEFLRNGGFSG